VVATLQQAQQLAGALVELVVAQRADHIAQRVQLESIAAVAVGEQVQEADRRLVLEQGGDRRAGAGGFVCHGGLIRERRPC